MRDHGNPIETLARSLSVIVPTVLLALAAHAQTIPDDLTAVPTNTLAPSRCMYFSIAHYGIWPPTPYPIPTVGDLYYSPSMLSTGMVAFFIDDVEAELIRMNGNSDLLPPGFDPNSTNNWSPPDYSPPTPPPPSDFGTNLWLVISTTLDTINGLTNYPNLRGVYGYLTALGNLSLAGCTNLTYAALAGCTNVSTATADAWFNNLATAQTNISHIASNFFKCSDPGASFFCPANKTSDLSTNAQSILIGKGWHLYFF